MHSQRASKRLNLSRRFVTVCLGPLFALLATSATAQLDRISGDEAARALRSALESGTQAAVSTLGKPDGFFGDSRVKIPLPDSLQRAESLMRRFGLGRQADELVLTMNRAAEAAVPEAKKLFVDAARKMTLQDAKGILTGGETAGTEYFRRTTGEQLKQRFLPIVKKVTETSGLARKYDDLAGKASGFGLVAKEQASVDQYVTDKALDGLFTIVATEEKKLRSDPVSAGTSLLRKVFGAIPR
jgi:hypothetical protein